MTMARTLVLVEGESDAAAVRALADRIGCDLEGQRIRVHPAAGVTNFPRVLAQFVREYPDAAVCGMYDVADERHVRRALAAAAAPIAGHASPEAAGFHACVADLEDELIRALGAEAVERVIEAQDELRSFRRFQSMPEHRDSPVTHQLHRFLGTRATRKIRCAQAMVEALDLARLPAPLRRLAVTMGASPGWPDGRGAL
jgi:hypothetical protein